ncbi:hypothetical protein E2C01_098120 [Portunus trituberculatus]|uniref:Uncharacterized protein n=1 Tax=Portunus trituberculatus TaxID=210409 RepID=A0A5B7K0F3_PORTR|nr:hypothetical protein [Portunus trituberculatus]
MTSPLRILSPSSYAPLLFGRDVLPNKGERGRVRFPHLPLWSPARLTSTSLSLKPDLPTSRKSRPAHLRLASLLAPSTSTRLPPLCPSPTTPPPSVKLPNPSFSPSHVHLPLSSHHSSLLILLRSLSFPVSLNRLHPTPLPVETKPPTRLHSCPLFPTHRMPA